MPTQYLEKPGYIYIVYRRNDFRDALQFRETVGLLIQRNRWEKDIIIDFSATASLTGCELSALTTIAKRFHGTSCRLKVIADKNQ